MNRLVLAVMLSIAALGRAVQSDEIAARALDLDFAASVEEWVTAAARVRLPEPYQTLVARLDADRYADRDAAGRKLLEACTADRSGQRWLLRARALERRPEVRYWLNRLLRQLNRCETCDGAGYCPEYRPVASEQPAYAGIPCQRCKRFEWQHGWQWIEGCRYGYLACDQCGGSGTYWNHYAVD